MEWNGVKLLWREDWAVALRSLTTAGQAKAFLDQYRREQPKWAEQIIGYLTAELPPPADAHARKLLGVVHPINPSGEKRSMSQALAGGIQMGASGIPPWLKHVLQTMPRKSIEPFFRTEHA